MYREPVHRTILAIDIERFGRFEWTDPMRVRVRARLRRLVDGALADAMIDPTQVHGGDTGDGMLILVDGVVPTTRTLHPLVATLAKGLAEDNGDASAAERLRLRLAVHAGTVVPDGHGYTGEAVTHTARLLNAQVGRMVLDAVPDAEIVLLASEAVYASVVRHAYQGIDPGGYQPVWIAEKETATRAWVHLPGLAVQPRLDRLHSPRPPLAHSPPARLMAQELPRDLRTFVGREEELARICAAGHAVDRTSATVIAAIDGMGGVGKSALAVHAAHPRDRTRDREQDHRGDRAPASRPGAPGRRPAAGSGGVLAGGPHHL